MASNAPNCCSICEETYNAEENCPRMLPCSHCFCEQCIWKLIRNNTKTCPLCRNTFIASSPQDVPMNRKVLEFMNYVEELERSFRSPTKRQGSSYARTIKVFTEENKEISKTNIANYRKNIDQIENDIKWNLEIKEELLQARKKIREELAPKLNEIEIKIEKLIIQIEDENESLKSQLKEIMTQEKLIKDLGAKLDSTYLNDAAPLMEEAEEANMKMKSKLEELEEYLAKQVELRFHIGMEAKNTENKIVLIQQILESKENEGVKLSTMEGAMALANAVLSHDRITIDVLRMMIKTNSIYAIQEYGGVQRYARITNTQNNDLLLHHLREEEGPLPSNSIFIQFIDVVKLVEESRTFLELGVDEARGRNRRSLGKIFIRLISDSDLSLNFTFLCTGEKGHSYANTNILKVDYRVHKRQSVCLGDDKTNNEEGMKGLYAMIHEMNERKRDIMHRRTQWVKGLLQSCLSTVSRFNIFTKDNPEWSDELYGIFGEVEEGLHILTEAISKYPNISNIKIIDCGLVLSRC